jgi:predicted nuclease with TOPRIM domain
VYGEFRDYIAEINSNAESILEEYEEKEAEAEEKRDRLAELQEAKEEGNLTDDDEILEYAALTADEYNFRETTVADNKRNALIAEAIDAAIEEGLQ